MNPHSSTKNYFESDLSDDQLKERLNGFYKQALKQLEEFVLTDSPGDNRREHLYAFFNKWLPNEPLYRYSRAYIVQQVIEDERFPAIATELSTKYRFDLAELLVRMDSWPLCQ